jgi:rRNA maturation protein Rpf1
MRINRGRSSLDFVFKKARSLGAKKLVLVYTWKGNPSLLFVSNVANYQLLSYARIKGVKLSYDMKRTVPETRPSGAFCVKSSDCPYVTDLLLNLGYSLLEDCDVNAVAEKKEDFCELTFLDRNSKIIPPVIKLAHDQGDGEIQRKWIGLITSVVEG